MPRNELVPNLITPQQVISKIPVPSTLAALTCTPLHHVALQMLYVITSYTFVQYESQTPETCSLYVGRTRCEK
jgi:hypothetical protein